MLQLKKTSTRSKAAPSMDACWGLRASWAMKRHTSLDCTEPETNHKHVLSWSQQFVLFVF